MKRLLTLPLVGVVAFASTAAGATTAQAPRDKLTGFVCRTALAPADRMISVRAVMRPLTGTKKMAVKFDLLSRGPGVVPFSEVRGGDLGTWIAPTDPSTLGQQPHDVWIVSHPVDNLPAPATYRFRVTFRWTGAHGKLLAVKTRLSQACRQPELRPDLVLQSIRVDPVPGKPRMNQYTAVIRNAGATAAGPFEITFAPGGATTRKTRTIQRLAPHTTREEAFIGPACTAATAPILTLDPGNQVDEFNNANNSLTATCPPATGP
jgi:hypothetical protein